METAIVQSLPFMDAFWGILGLVPVKFALKLLKSHAFILALLADRG